MPKIYHQAKIIALVVLIGLLGAGIAIYIKKEHFEQPKQVTFYSAQNYKNTTKSLPVGFYDAQALKSLGMLSNDNPPSNSVKSFKIPNGLAVAVYGDDNGNTTGLLYLYNCSKLEKPVTSVRAIQVEKTGTFGKIANVTGNRLINRLKR